MSAVMHAAPGRRTTQLQQQSTDAHVAHATRSIWKMVVFVQICGNGQCDLIISMRSYFCASRTSHKLRRALSLQSCSESSLS